MDTNVYFEITLCTRCEHTYTTDTDESVMSPSRLIDVVSKTERFDFINRLGDIFQTVEDGIS